MKLTRRQTLVAGAAGATAALTGLPAVGVASTPYWHHEPSLQLWSALRKHVLLENDVQYEMVWAANDTLAMLRFEPHPWSKGLLPVMLQAAGKELRKHGRDFRWRADAKLEGNAPTYGLLGYVSRQNLSSFYKPSWHDNEPYGCELTERYVMRARLFTPNAPTVTYDTFNSLRKGDRFVTYSADGTREPGGWQVCTRDAFVSDYITGKPMWTVGVAQND